MATSVSASSILRRCLAVASTPMASRDLKQGLAACAQFGSPGGRGQGMSHLVIQAHSRKSLRPRCNAPRCFATARTSAFVTSRSGLEMQQQQSNKCTNVWLSFKIILQHTCEQKVHKKQHWGTNLRTSKLSAATSPTLVVSTRSSLFVPLYKITRCRDCNACELPTRALAERCMSVSRLVRIRCKVE